MELYAWLASVKRLQAQQDAAAERAPLFAGPAHYNVELIQHGTRHSDLRLYTYRPSALQGAGQGPGAGGRLGPAGLEDSDFEGSGPESPKALAGQLPLSEEVASLEGTALLASSGGGRAPGRGGDAAGGGVRAGCGSLARMNPLTTVVVEDLEQVRPQLLVLFFLMLSLIHPLSCGPVHCTEAAVL